ncbi:hypothetical protein HYX06_05415 [Candidatus Woesearchaeota archaeon]|nr:hypothetical protein [Candidatus Woesearchaeota archaeon]
MEKKPKKIPKRRRWRKTRAALLVSAIVGAYTEFLDQDYEYRAITGKDDYMFNSPSIVKGEFEGYRVSTTDNDRRPVVYLVAINKDTQPQVIFYDRGWMYDIRVCFSDEPPKKSADSIDEVAQRCFEVKERIVKTGHGFWESYEPIFDGSGFVRKFRGGWNPFYGIFHPNIENQEIVSEVRIGYTLARRARDQTLGK